MTQRLNPYLSFPAGNAREAMEFYHSVFGGTLRLNTFDEYGTSGPEFEGKIMHGMLETDSGFALMGADAPAAMKPVTVGNNITVSLSGDDADDLRGYWEKLAAAGTVQVPLEKQVWGDEYGSVTDQFGIEWMVNIGPSQA